MRRNDENYQTPEISILELHEEGVLCSSLGDGNESLDENEGIW
jgi:hypothetical protein